MIYLPIPVKILVKHVLNKVPRSLKQGQYQIRGSRWWSIFFLSDVTTVVSFQASGYLVKDKSQSFETSPAFRVASHHTVKLHAGIGITFFSMCQMAPSILFQWDISNFNGPFDNLNAPKDRNMRYGILMHILMMYVASTMCVIACIYVHVLESMIIAVMPTWSDQFATESKRIYMNCCQVMAVSLGAQ